MPAPSPSQLAASFGLTEIADESLSPWASVYRATTPDGRRVVVKRTATTDERASAMAGWTTAMNDAGIAVVTPIDLEVPNPQQVGTDWWVTYPFVSGRPYRATATDLEAAGDLLGQIHAAPIDPELLAPMRHYEWPQSTREDLDAELESLRSTVATHLGLDAAAAAERLDQLGDRWWTDSLPRLREADRSFPLPRAAVSSDYKANNLVFAESCTTLIDPDNGGVEPRMFDLAMAVVLFHTEHATAPTRLFTKGEWRTFVTAYSAHVEFTDQERQLWPAALDHIFWEEGTWVLEDSDPAEWLDPRQGAYLRDLAMAMPEHYPLPKPAGESPGVTVGA